MVKIKANCEYCEYFDYDEEMDANVCTLNLDMDYL